MGSDSIFQATHNLNSVAPARPLFLFREALSLVADRDDGEQIGVKVKTPVISLVRMALQKNSWVDQYIEYNN